MKRFFYNLLNTERGMALRRTYNRYRTWVKSLNLKQLLYQFFTHPFVVIPGIAGILFLIAATVWIYRPPPINTKTLPVSVQNLRNISAAYVKAAKKLKHPPSNLDELMPYLKEFGEPEQMLRSPDDNHPYVIYWGVDYLQSGTMGNPLPVLAHEKQGAGNRRYVLRGKVIWHLTEDEFKQLPLPLQIK